MAEQVFKIAIQIGANGAPQAARIVGNSMKTIASESKRAKGGVDSLARSFSQLQTIATVLGVQQLTKNVIEAGMVFKRADNALRSILGSTQAAAAEMNFLTGEASRLGMAIGDMLPIYGKFAAAIAESAMTAEQGRKIFTSVAEAGVVMGLSADQTRGALNALTQMVSKGTVQMEELKGQLGDRMPAAMATMAKAMGMSIPEMSKMIESGKVLASDVLPKFAVELDRVFGAGVAEAAQFSANQIARIKNAFTELGAVAEAELAPALAEMAAELQKFAKSPEAVQLARDLGETLAALAKTTSFAAENFGILRDVLVGLAAMKVSAMIAGWGAALSALAMNPAVAAFIAVGATLAAFNVIINESMRQSEQYIDAATESTRRFHSELEKASATAASGDLKAIEDGMEAAMEASRDAAGQMATWTRVWQDVKEEAAATGESLEEVANRTMGTENGISDLLSAMQGARAEMELQDEIWARLVAALKEAKAASEAAAAVNSEVSAEQAKLTKKYEDALAKLRAKIDQERILASAHGKGAEAMVSARIAAETLNIAQQIGVENDRARVASIGELVAALDALEARQNIAPVTDDDFGVPGLKGDTGDDVSGGIGRSMADLARAAQELANFREQGLEFYKEQARIAEDEARLEEELAAIGAKRGDIEEGIIRQRIAAERALEDEIDTAEKANAERAKAIELELKAAKKRAEQQAEDISKIISGAIRESVETGEIDFSSMWDSFKDMAFQAMEDVLQEWLAKKAAMEAADVQFSGESGGGGLGSMFGQSQLGTAGIVIAAFALFDKWASGQQQKKKTEWSDYQVFSGGIGGVNVGVAEHTGIEAEQARAAATAMSAELQQLAMTLGIAGTELGNFSIEVNAVDGSVTAFVRNMEIGKFETVEEAWTAILGRMVDGVEVASANMQAALDRASGLYGDPEQLGELLALAQELDRVNMPATVGAMQDILIEWVATFDRAKNAGMDLRDAVKLLAEDLLGVRDSLQGQLDRFLDPSGAMSQIEAFQKLQDEIAGYNTELERQKQVVSDLADDEIRLADIREETLNTNPLSTGNGASPGGTIRPDQMVVDDIVENWGDLQGALTDWALGVGGTTDIFDAAADTFSGAADAARDFDDSMSNLGGGSGGGTIGGVTGALGELGDTSEDASDIVADLVGDAEDVADAFTSVAESLPDPIEMEEVARAQALMIAGLEKSLGEGILKYISNEELRQRVMQANFQIEMATLEAQYQALVASGQVAQAVLDTYRAALDELEALGPGVVGAGTSGGFSRPSGGSSGVAERQARRREIRAEMGALEDLILNGPPSSSMAAWEETKKQIAELADEMASLSTFTQEEIDRMGELQRQKFLVELMAPIEDMLRTLGMTDVERQVDAIEQLYDGLVETAIAAGATQEQLALLNEARQAEIEAIREGILGDAQNTIDSAGRSDVGNALAEINARYDALVADAEATGASAEELAILNDARQVEIDALRADHQSRVDALAQTTFQTGQFTQGLFDLQEELKQLAADAIELGMSLDDVNAAGHAATQQLGFDFLNSLNSISGFKMPPEIAARMIEMQRAMVLMDLASLAAAGAFEFLNGELPAVPRTVEELMANFAEGGYEGAWDMGAALIQGFFDGASSVDGAPMISVQIPENSPFQDASEEGNGLLQDLLDAINDAFDGMLDGLSDVENAVYSSGGGSDNWNSVHDAWNEAIRQFREQWIYPQQGEFMSQVMALQAASERLMEAAVAAPGSWQETIANIAIGQAEQLLKRSILQSLRGGPDLQGQFDAIIARFQDATAAIEELGLMSSATAAELDELRSEAIQEFLDGVNKGFQDILDSFKAGGQYGQLSGRDEVNDLFSQFQSLSSQVAADPFNQGLRSDLEEVIQQLLSSGEAFGGSGPLFQRIIEAVQGNLEGLILNADDFQELSDLNGDGNITLDELLAQQETEMDVLQSMDGLLVEIRDGINDLRGYEEVKVATDDEQIRILEGIGSSVGAQLALSKSDYDLRAIESARSARR